VADSFIDLRTDTVDNVSLNTVVTKHNVVLTEMKGKEFNGPTLIQLLFKVGARLLRRISGSKEQEADYSVRLNIGIVGSTPT
jgi:hypothetical protein